MKIGVSYCGFGEVPLDENSQLTHEEEVKLQCLGVFLHICTVVELSMYKGSLNYYKLTLTNAVGIIV